MRLFRLSAVLCALMAAPLPLVAGEDAGAIRLGGDVFAAGQAPVIADPGTDDAFVVGDDVVLSAAIGGSAHLAGRDVRVTGTVAGDVYAAGYHVALDAPVTGDATLAGYSVTAGPVAGDLRAAGRRVALSGPVGGYATVSGDRVTIDALVAGDLVLAVRSATFGPDARVAGRVIVVAERGDGAFAVPDRVAPAARVERLTPGAAAARPDLPAPSAVSAAARGTGAWVFRLVILTLLVTAAALLLPERMARARVRLLARPWAALALGAITLSALMGAVVLAASTLVGLVLVPILLLAVPVAAVAGYIVGAHALGVRITAALGLPAPTVAPAQARAAAAGVLALALAGLVPILGWIVLMAVCLAGLAMLVPGWARPAV